jgi:GH15 family glucan-1,4-alpha-glucosidase
MAESDAVPKPAPNAMPDIEAHGLVGNMQTTAYVSTAGSVDFMCFPRFDSPTVFASLLKPGDGGSFDIAPELRGCKVKQLYLPETNVLLTRFMTPDAVCEIVDFMPVIEERPGEEPQANRLIRIVKALYGDVTVNVKCAPRFNYARSSHEAIQTQPTTVEFAASGGSESLHFHSTSPVEVRGGDAVGKVVLKEGESAWFRVGDVMDGSDDALPCPVALEETIQYWRSWSTKSTYRGRYREVVLRSALVLKLMISRQHGAIIAAPTFGLPETPEGGRRWDYRYTWIRDAAFSVYALLRLGYTGEAQKFMDWIGERASRCGNDGSFNVMYAIDGKEPPEEATVSALHGSGEDPPVIGNAARDQLQLDVYGALMDAVYLYNKYGEAIPYDGWINVTRTVNYVVEHWRDADEGIWEFRNGRRPLLHSRLMCWVALDRALRLAEKRSLPAPFAMWFKERDAIHVDIFKNFWNADLKSFVQTPNSDTLDASTLMMPLVRFISPTDPRWLSTLDAIGRELCVDPLVFRYTRGSTLDGLAGEEGGFSACSFWYAEALARAGRVHEGRLIFAKMLKYANHVGLFSEEVAISGESLGNFPQALTHLALISAAFQLDRSLDGVKAPWS